MQFWFWIFKKMFSGGKQITSANLERSHLLSFQKLFSELLEGPSPGKSWSCCQDLYYEAFR